MTAYSLIKELEKAVPLIAYKEAKIPKNAGGFRKIFIPAPELKLIQKKIILRFLRKLIERDRLIKINELLFVSWYSPRAYNESYAKHAKLHSDSRFIFQFDIKDAFPSVSSSMIRGVVRGLIDRYPGVDPEDQEKLVDLIAKLTTFNGLLPQGAPTSPLLFYIFVIESGLYGDIAALCHPGWKVSFYVDNFAISGKKPVPEELKEQILKRVNESGLKVNEAKTYRSDCRQGVPLVTGVRVDGIKERISLSKKTIRKWRGIIYKAAITNDPDLIEKVEGFVSSLRPIYGSDLPPQIAKPLVLLKKKIQENYPREKKETDFNSKNFYPVKKGIQARLTKWS